MWLAAGEGCGGSPPNPAWLCSSSPWGSLSHPGEFLVGRVGTLSGLNASVAWSIACARRCAGGRGRGGGRCLPAPQLVPQGSPKPALLGRACKPTGSTSPWRDRGAPRGWLAQRLGPPHSIPAPCPPQPWGDAPRGGVGGEQQGRGAVPANAVPADAEQIGFPMVIGPVQSGDTDLFVPGRTRKGSPQGLGLQRGSGAGARGCWEHPGVLQGSWGLPSVGGHPQVPPRAQSKPAEALQKPSSPSQPRQGTRPPRSPASTQPTCHRQHPSPRPRRGGVVPKPPAPSLRRGRGVPAAEGRACAPPGRVGFIALPALGSRR